MYLSKLVAETSGASIESLRLKEELDQTRGRLHDEISAALKPSKNAAGSTGVTAAWKKVEPLEKAVDNAGSDMHRKLTKVSNLLSKLTEDLPLIVQVLEEPERERELIDKIESLDSELEMVQAESIELAAEVERVSNLLIESENQNLEMKKAIEYSKLVISRQQKTCEKFSLRCGVFEDLINMGSDIIMSLEEQAIANEIEEKEFATTNVSEVQISFKDREEEIVGLYAQINLLHALNDEQELKLQEAEENMRRLQDEKDAVVDSAFNSLEIAEANTTDLHNQVIFIMFAPILSRFNDKNVFEGFVFTG